MDHPLIDIKHNDIRRRVIHLLKSAYSVLGDGNLIFVCGGNDPCHMRQKFKIYCEINHPELHIFFPEFAMKNYFSNANIEPFDITDFEKLVGELSHAIVIFPEAAGSFAETGYFSALPQLARKTILAMDSEFQSKDSFISLGPAVKINSASIFNPSIQIKYKEPLFDDIVQRIRRFPMQKRRKALQLKKFKELSSYELFCLLHKSFEILRIATIDDIIYLFRGLFGSISENQVKKITSILLGSEYLLSIGDYGHYYTNPSKKGLLVPREGFSGEETELLLQLATIYNSGGDEFLNIIRGIKYVN